MFSTKLQFITSLLVMLFEISHVLYLDRLKLSAFIPLIVMFINLEIITIICNDSFPKRSRHVLSYKIAINWKENNICLAYSNNWENHKKFFAKFLM